MEGLYTPWATPSATSQLWVAMQFLFMGKLWKALLGKCKIEKWYFTLGNEDQDSCDSWGLHENLFFRLEKTLFCTNKHYFSEENSLCEKRKSVFSIYSKIWHDISCCLSPFSVRNNFEFASMWKMKLIVMMLSCANLTYWMLTWSSQLTSIFIGLSR